MQTLCKSFLMLDGFEGPGGNYTLEKGLILDKPARLIIRLLFGFAYDSLFVKLSRMINK